ncbi:uroporphyrinogen-III synthase [soil metagenome]
MPGQSGGSTALTGCIVVVTRPSPGPLARRLADAGATVRHVPLIEVRSPADSSALTDAIARLGDHTWLVVTSANGAAAVGEAPRSHPGVRLGAVGPATAAALQDRAGRPVDLVPGRASVEGLLDEFPSPARAGESVLVVQADRAGDDLARGLRSRGYHVTTVAGYRTVLRRPTADEEATLRSADVVVLASGSAAESLAAESLAAMATTSAAHRSGPQLVAIGPSTTAAAVTAGLRMSAVARSPRPEDVVAAVVGVVEDRRSSAPGLT